MVILADGSAFEIFEHVQIDCPIIFTTAYDEYALKAFKVNSIDYLLKPIGAADLTLALEKLHTLHPASEAEGQLSALIRNLQKHQSYKTHFLIPHKGDKLLPLDVERVQYFCIAGGHYPGRCRRPGELCAAAHARRVGREPRSGSIFPGQPAVSDLA